MKSNIRNRISVALLKALALIFLTVGIAAIARVIFVDNMFEQEYFEDHILNILFMVFFLFIFSSLVVALHSHDKYVMESFLAHAESKNSSSAIKFTITSLEFYIELVCITIVSLILPSDLLYGFIAKSFFYNAEITDFQIKLYTLLIMLPLLFILDFFARVSVAKKWYQRSRKTPSASASEKKSKIPPTIKNIIMVAIVYCAASLVIPWFLPLIITLWNMGGVVGFIWILVCIISAIAIIIASFYIRAIFKRKDFVTKLKKYCKSNSIYISDIKNPYRSIFVSKREQFKNANAQPVKLSMEEIDEDWLQYLAFSTGIDASNIQIVAYENHYFEDMDTTGSGQPVAFWVQIILAVIILALLAFVVIRSAKPLTVEETEPELSVEDMLATTKEKQPTVEDIDLQNKSETRKAIEKFVDENPEAVALLLRNWLNDGWD